MKVEFADISAFGYRLPQEQQGFGPRRQRVTGEV
jgi:hypothetical protein